MSRFGDWLLGRTHDPDELLERVGPIEGTSVSLWNDGGPIDQFWNQYRSGWPAPPQLATQVWVANRCIQLNSQQIAGMPLVWHGPASEDSEPAWISSPDSNLFPNGVGDALFAIVGQVYSWGYSLQWITDYYANGFPRTWTIIDSAKVTPQFEDGRRIYKTLGGDRLDASRIVQIDRNPSTAAHGTSALSAYASTAYGLMAAQEQSRSVSDGAVPLALLKPQQRVTKEQADDIREGWRQAAASRGNVPAIIPPNLEYEQLSFNPTDMALLETQEWDARVIATAYGVPAVLLNMSLQGGLTYQNPASLGEMWWRFELRPTATRIANAFSAQMLPRGQFVTFDAADTFAPITEASTVDDPQLSQVADASPTQQPPALVAVGGTP